MHKLQTELGVFEAEESDNFFRHGVVDMGYSDRQH